MSLFCVPTQLHVVLVLSARMCFDVFLPDLMIVLAVTNRMCAKLIRVSKHRTNIKVVDLIRNGLTVNEEYLRLRDNPCTLRVPTPFRPSASDEGLSTL